MKKAVTVILFLIAIANTAFAQKNIDTKNWELFTDMKYLVTAKYPKNWELKTTNPNSFAVFKSPLEDSTDNFRENINLIIKEIKSPAKVKDAIPKMIESLKSVVDSFTLIKSGAVPGWNGGNAWEIQYKGIYKTDPTPIVIIQRIGLHNGQLLTVTYSSQGNKKDIYQETAKAIINTITF